MRAGSISARCCFVRVALACVALALIAALPVQAADPPIRLGEFLDITGGGATAAETTKFALDIAVADIPVYAVRILVPATEGAFEPFDVFVGGVRPNTPGAEALIGTDLLANFTFTYRGPLGDFVLSAEDGLTGLPGPRSVARINADAVR